MSLDSQKIYLGELNNTSLGDLRLAASDLGLLAVEWRHSQPELDSYLRRFEWPTEENDKKMAPYAKELLEYIYGKLRQFTFNIDWLSLGPFQRKAMQAVYAVPYGQTRAVRSDGQFSWQSPHKCEFDHMEQHTLPAWPFSGMGPRTANQY